ncbi:MAG: nitrogen regulation protein NR(I) [Pelistega sp.]|nr:nitrogen regulation protein NR(I) [Pelistega sp.]
MSKIWVIDDDQGIRWVLDKALQKAGLQARTFENSASLLSALEYEKPDVLVTDIRMPDISGLELLALLKQKIPDLLVIVMTAYTDLDSTVQAFQEGAFDYLAKPFDINDAVKLIKRACEQAQQTQQPIEVSQDIAMSPTFARMMSQSYSKAMQEVFRAIGRLAPSKVTVLITGESGTGKELIARAVHQHGSRANKPFVALNAAAIPKDLLEAELFGHERGSFTGASNRRKGRFEEADGGTLFLDEIGDMPLDLQTRLLRVLAEGSFYRIGGVEPVTVDVRIIAATHQPLETRVEQGLFREDLFHRLNVIRLRIPPLRERKEDIPRLITHFLKQSAQSLDVPIKTLSYEVMEIIQSFDFPGNVRQLENFCHWLTVMTPAQIVTTADLPQELLASLRARIDTTNESMTGALATGDSEGLGLSNTDTSTKSHTAPSANAVDNRSLANPQVFNQVLGNYVDTPGLNLGQTGSASTAIGSTNTSKSSADRSTAMDWELLLRRDVAQRLALEDSALMTESLMDDLTRTFERAVLETTLQFCRGRRVDAAAKLGIGRNTVTRKLKELGLKDI